MALETFDNQIDIRGLSIESVENEKHPDVPFNPAKDIPTRDWRWIREEMRANIKTDTDKFLEHAALIDLIQPGENNWWREQGLGDDVFNYIKGEMESWDNDGSIDIHYESARVLAFHAKLLFPNKFESLEFPYEIGDRPERSIEYSVRQSKIRQGSYEPAYEEALAIITLYPDAIKAYNSKASLSIEIRKGLMGSNDSYNAALLLAISKMVYGSEKLSDLAGQFPELWNDLKARLSETRGAGKFLDFLKTASVMTVLAAPEVKATEGSLQISFGAPERPEESNQSMPASRKF